jgi:hypothetical protein
MGSVTVKPGLASASVGRTTVVITAHNYGRYLAQCIESVLCQSCAPAYIIVIDDASDDNTADVVRGYLPRVEYHYAKFRNAQYARNLGLALVSTEYVMFVDADDLLAEMAIERLEGALDRSPVARVAYCDKYVFGDAAAMERLHLGGIWRAPEFSIATLRLRNFIMLTSLVRRAHIVAFDDRIKRLQDWDLWLSMLRSDSDAIHVPEPLLHYRVHGQNLSIRQRELIERLKILAKHGLITMKRNGAGSARARTLAILTRNPEGVDPTAWQAVARQHDWRVRAFAGHAPDVGDSLPARHAVVRNGRIVLQTAPCDDVEDLLWRFAGAVTDDRIDAVVVTRDLRRVFVVPTPTAQNQAVLWIDRPLADLLAATSLEDLGTFALSPAAVRQLLYLPPGARPTRVARLRRAAAEFASQHIAWRFQRRVVDDRHHGR